MNSVFTKEHGGPIMFAEIAIPRALGGKPEVPPIPIGKVTLVFYLPIIIFEAMLEANANKPKADESRDIEWCLADDRRAGHHLERRHVMMKLLRSTRAIPAWVLISVTGLVPRLTMAWGRMCRPRRSRVRRSRAGATRRGASTLAIFERYHAW
jgi:hypothetical protein